MILVNAQQMREIDQCAINHFHIPGIVLMENAGLGTVLMMERRLGSLRRQLIPIFIGPGNNGGDGLVIARHLQQRAAIPFLIYLIEPHRLKGDSGANQRIVEQTGIEAIVCTSETAVEELPDTILQLENRYGKVAVLVDSIFGTGLDRAIEGHFAAAVNLINVLAAARAIPVVAVDTPSGLNSDDGTQFNTCIRASLTATYGYVKTGQALPESTPFTGELEVIDIGLPAGVLNHVPVHTAAVDQPDCQSFTSQLRRDTGSHKGSFGHLLILAGSIGKTGAAILAAKGALRSGCGLISVCAPTHLNTIYETALTEPMSIVLESFDHLSINDLSRINEQLRGKDCVVMGPGIGEDEETAELVVELYSRVSQPMLIDADALNILAARKKRLPRPSGPRILTPHPGEMARLLDLDSAAVQADRFAALHACFEQFKTPEAELIIILKGSGTLITDGSTTWLNRTGNPAIASGGMGDVLTGVIGSLICQQLSCTAAAVFGTYLHGFSGDRLQKRMGVGFGAADLADDLPLTLKTLIG
ncbi:MAG: NAD(P)H-hydrate dehydratase [Desulfofustis sp.]